jgi:hypothetical protein
VEEVFAFASNIANFPLYDKGVREVKKTTEGPIGVGTKYHFQFGIRMGVFQVFTAHEPNGHFAFRVNSGLFPVETHYTFASLGNGTQLCGGREPQPRGIWIWLIPLISIPARQKFEAELNSLKNYLETHS